MTVTQSSDRILEWATRLRGAIGPLERQLRQQTTSPYSPTQTSVLGAIYRHGPIPMTELANRERLSLPSVSKTVASLEQAGIVARMPDAEDRRVWRATLTDAGRRWIERNRTRNNEWLAERIARLSASDQAELAAAVPVLERLLEEER